MAKKSKQHLIWERDQTKAEAMTQKFIAAIKRLDPLSSWDQIMMKAIARELAEDKRGKEEVRSALEDVCGEWGLEVVNVDNLNAMFRFEAFKEELERNPYQLNLI